MNTICALAFALIISLYTHSSIRLRSDLVIFKKDIEFVKKSPNHGFFLEYINLKRKILTFLPMKIPGYLCHRQLFLRTYYKYLILRYHAYNKK